MNIWPRQESRTRIPVSATLPYSLLPTPYSP